MLVLLFFDLGASQTGAKLPANYQKNMKLLAQAIREGYCILVLTFCLLPMLLSGQDYGNNWIQSDQEYFEVTVHQDGVYQVSAELLMEAGLPADASGYQVMSRGEEVPVYLSAEEMTDGEYLQFYGERNDGWLDTRLFRYPHWHQKPEWSLFTDTSAYYITWSEEGSSKRMQDVENDLTAEAALTSSYVRKSMKLSNNAFYGGEPFRLAGLNHNFAEYENGEGFSSGLISPGLDLNFTLQTPDVDLYGGNALLNIRLQGRSNDFLVYPEHHFEIYFNELYCYEYTFEGYQQQALSIPIPVSQIDSQTRIRIHNTDLLSENNVTSMIAASMTYPSQFVFAGSKEARFELDNVAQGIQLCEFDGGDETVVWDMSQMMRLEMSGGEGEYVCHLPSGNPNLFKRELYCFNEQSAVREVSQIKQIDFPDFFDPELQGDFVIIAAPQLFGPELDDYVAYRSSEVGGGHQVVLVDVEDLYDQYAFGLRKHPLSIRNFINFALDQWQVKPEYLLLMGKAIDYRHCRYNAQAFEEKNLVPAFGSPPSDLMLVTSGNESYVPQIAVGRLPVTERASIGHYLEKLRSYEDWQSFDCDSYDREWMKDCLNLIGGYDPNQEASFRTYLDSYVPLLQDTLFGGNLKATLTQGQPSIKPQPELPELMQQGAGLITFMGHPLGDEWHFDVLEASEYNNEGKYPFINANSCFSGNIFNETGQLMAEDFVLTEKAGAIGYLAVVNFGFPYYLDIFNKQFYLRLFRDNYGQSVGQCMLEAIQDIERGDEQGLDALGIKRTSQALVLAGDPAVELLHRDLPDYYFKDSAASLVPEYLETGADSFLLEINTGNRGKAIADSSNLEIILEQPDGTLVPFERRVPALLSAYPQRIFVELPDEPEEGLYQLHLRLDKDDEVQESCEENNSTSISFWLAEQACSQEINLDQIPDTLCVTAANVFLNVIHPDATFILNQDTTSVLDPSQLDIGLQVLRCVVQEDCGILSATKFVEISDTLRMQIQSSDWICQGDTAYLQLVGDTSLLAALEWDFGSDAEPETATGKGPFEVLYSSVGEKMIRAISSSNCGVDTLEHITNVVNPSPPVMINCLETGYSSVTIGWEEVDATFFAIYLNGVQYNIFSDTNYYRFSNLQQETDYSIRMKVLGNSLLASYCPEGELSNEISCTTGSCEEVLVSLTGLDAYYCIDDEAVSLMGEPAGGTFFGKGVNENSFDPAEAGIGIHWITYSWQDTVGQCSYNVQESLRVNFYPRVALEGDSLICQNGISPVYATEGFTSYSWNAQNPIEQYWFWAEQPGVVEVQAIDGNFCDAIASYELFESELIADHVDLGPDTILEVGQTLSLSPGLDFEEYRWSTGDSLANIEVFETGTYSLTVTCANGCYARGEVEVGFEEATGLEAKTEVFRVYPNPFSEQLVLSASQAGRYELWSLQGKLVQSGSVEKGEQHILLDRLPDGIYLLAFFNEENQPFLQRILHQ